MTKLGFVLSGLMIVCIAIFNFMFGIAFVKDNNLPTLLWIVVVNGFAFLMTMHIVTDSSGGVK